jgi:hypothetical protein
LDPKCHFEIRATFGASVDYPLLQDNTPSKKAAVAGQFTKKQRPGCLALAPF